MAKKKSGEAAGSIEVVVRDSDGVALHTQRHPVDDVLGAIDHVRQLSPGEELGIDDRRKKERDDDSNPE